MPSFATYSPIPTLELCSIRCRCAVGSDLLGDMGDSPRQEYSASLPFGALIAEALCFARVAVLDVFRLSFGRVTGESMECIRSLPKMEIVFFSAAFELFVLSTRLWSNPIQHVRFVYSLHVWVLVGSLRTAGTGVCLWKKNGDSS